MMDDVLERLINHLSSIPCPVENFELNPPRRIRQSSPSPVGSVIALTILDLLSNDDCMRFLKARNMNFDKTVYIFLNV
jgi:hypothetical protein